jgi:hypothetical protein
VTEWFGMWAVAAVLAMAIGMAVAYALERHARERVVIPAANWVRRRRRRKAIERDLVRISIRDAQLRDALEPHAERGLLPYRRGWRGGRR